MSNPSLLCIPGSLRTASVNRMLAAEAIRLFGPADGVTADLRLPLYDGDAEEADGIPTAVQTLSEQVAAADAIIISTPEYNKGIPGVLKNALDWVSRTAGAPMKGKPVAIMSAAAGRTGGETAQFMLRACLVSFQPHLIPRPTFALAGAANEFDASGRLISDRYTAALQSLMDDLRSAAG